VVRPGGNVDKGNLPKYAKWRGFFDDEEKFLDARERIGIW
jgi:hypothetical protein